jgi:MFS family permease
VRKTGGRWNLGVLGATTLVQVIGGMVMQSIAVTGPILSRELSLTPLEFGVLVSSVSIGSSLALPVGWVVGRRIGTRYLLVGSALLAGAMVLGAGLAQSSVAVVALLLLAGFGWGLSIPVGGGAVATAAPPGHRGLFTSIRQLALPLGGMAASVLAPVIVALYSWRAMLVIEGLLFAGTAGVVARSRLPVRKRAAGRQRPAPAILPLGLAGLTVSGVQWAFIAYLTIDVTSRLHKSFAFAAALFLVSQVAGAVGRLVVGWMSDRLGPGRTRVLAATSLASGLSLFVFAALASRSPITLILAVCAVNGFLVMGWNGILIAAFAEAGPVDDATLNIAAGQSMNRIGSMVAPPLFGLALSNQIGSGYLWPVLGILSALAALGFILAGRWFAPIDRSWLAMRPGVKTPELAPEARL